jgi:hypothetical protein
MLGGGAGRGAWAGDGARSQMPFKATGSWAPGSPFQSGRGDRGATVTPPTKGCLEWEGRWHPPIRSQEEPDCSVSGVAPPILKYIFVRFQVHFEVWDNSLNAFSFIIEIIATYFLSSRR